MLCSQGIFVHRFQTHHTDRPHILFLYFCFFCFMFSSVHSDNHGRIQCPTLKPSVMIRLTPCLFIIIFLSVYVDNQTLVGWHRSPERLKQRILKENAKMDC